MAAIFRPSLFYANLFRILMLAQYSVTGWYFFTRVQPKLDWNDEEIQLRMKIAPSYLSLWNAVSVKFCNYFFVIFWYEMEQILFLQMLYLCCRYLRQYLYLFSTINSSARVTFKFLY